MYVPGKCVEHVDVMLVFLISYSEYKLFVLTKICCYDYITKQGMMFLYISYGLNYRNQLHTHILCKLPHCLKSSHS